MTREEPRVWVGVASRAHVRRAVQGGFMQLNHGKRAPLERIRPGDFIVYYSPREDYPDGAVLKAFTAVGEVKPGDIYQADQSVMGNAFFPFRRDVAYEKGRDVRVDDLKDRLHFIQKNPNWGMLARRGTFEIDLHDLDEIRAARSEAERAARSRSERALT